MGILFVSSISITKSTIGKYYRQDIKQIIERSAKCNESTNDKLEMRFQNTIFIRNYLCHGKKM